MYCHFFVDYQKYFNILIALISFLALNLKSIVLKNKSKNS